MVNISKDMLSRCKHKISEEDLTRIQKAMNYDLMFLTETFNDNLVRAGRPFSCEQIYPIIARFGKADFEIAQLLEEEFKKFVALTLMFPGESHAPFGAVDMYWHFFILHTEHYIKFCEEIWGNFKGDPKFRHHFPATNDTRPGMLQAYVSTRRHYTDVFGDPEPYVRPGARSVEVWTPATATCGDSYSGMIEPEQKTS